ncbi:MAG: ParB/RepB/Spo0J family partition protein, partial [Pseudomonadota bacterium]
RELALIENIQRADLNPIEEAEAFEALIKKYKLTQQELADRLGKDRVSIANTLRLLKLHPDLRGYVKSGEISQGQAKVLLSIDESALQKKIGMETVRKKLTVRATEKLVAKAKQTGVVDDVEAQSEEIQVSKRLAKALAIELQKKLKTRVAIDYNEGKGRLKINFHSDVELNQIVDKLRV